MTQTTRSSEIATPDEVAKFLKSDTTRLGKQRMAGTGPRFIKDGRRILYRWADVEAWLIANSHDKTVQS